MDKHGIKSYDILSILFIIIGEILLFFGYRMASLAVHSLNIITVVGIVILKEDIKLVQALSLVSLLRIVNTSMPIFFSLTIYWFSSLYGVMLVPIMVVIKDQGLSLREIGVTLKRIYLWLIAIPIGIGLSLLEYYTLTPEALIPDFTPENIIKISIVMIFFIGLVEEIVFRLLLQKRLEEKIGLTNGLLVTSMIFGFMHSGYSNYNEILFTTFAGLVLGFCFQRTKNLPIIVIAHGFNNIFLFGVLPFFMPGLVTSIDKFVHFYN